MGETKTAVYSRTAMCPDTIFFLLHCGAKPPNYGRILTHFSLSCNLVPRSLNCIAFIYPNTLTYIPIDDSFETIVKSHNNFITSVGLCLNSRRSKFAISVLDSQVA